MVKSFASFATSTPSSLRSRPPPPCPTARGPPARYRAVRDGPDCQGWRGVRRQDADVRALRRLVRGPDRERIGHRCVQSGGGGTLKNVIIGKNQMEGVHCDNHDCTIENVWWDDCVQGHRCGGARSADDKVIQHNGYGTVNIDGFYGEDISKLYRSCGTCGDKAKKVSVSNVYVVNPGNAIVTVNKNWGDEATLSNIWVKSSGDKVKICQWSQGNANGEPSMLGDGPSPPLCQYSESDVHINGDVSQSTGTSSNSTATTGSGSSTSTKQASSGSTTQGDEKTGASTSLRGSSNQDTTEQTETSATSTSTSTKSSKSDDNKDQSDDKKSQDENTEQTEEKKNKATTRRARRRTTTTKSTAARRRRGNRVCAGPRTASSFWPSTTSQTRATTLTLPQLTMVKSFASFATSTALLIAVATAASVPDGTWPTSTGTVQYATAQIVKAGEVFDGKMQTFERSDVSCEGQTESGSDTAVFKVEAGGTLKNVIIGKNQMEGVHCDNHDCTIENVWWDDVCEDALSIKGGTASSVSKVIGGGARSADDKVIQHNGYGTVNIDGFYGEDISKLYRSCGTCGDKAKKVSVSNVYVVNPGNAIVTVNKNWGDEATLSNIWVKSSGDKVKICQWSQGNANGEPSMLGDGPSPPLCQYSESDVHINGDVSQSTGTSSNSTATTGSGSSTSTKQASSGSTTQGDEKTGASTSLRGSSNQDTTEQTETSATSTSTSTKSSKSDDNKDQSDDKKSQDENTEQTEERRTKRRQEEQEEGRRQLSRPLRVVVVETEYVLDPGQHLRCRRCSSHCVLNEFESSCRRKRTVRSVRCLYM
ncbi:Pectin lyase fold [Phytophthora cactorum]|nr:Pectin lyase fold [Phytophthora cactorum]